MSSTDDHFYIYLPSNGDSKHIFPHNRPSNYSIPLADPLNVDVQNWEVGLAEITFPNVIYNIHGDMRKITIGNQRSERKILFPAGQYTAQSFCKTLNLILKHVKLIYKDNALNNGLYPDSNKNEWANFDTWLDINMAKIYQAEEEWKLTHQKKKPKRVKRKNKNNDDDDMGKQEEEDAYENMEEGVVGIETHIPVYPIDDEVDPFVMQNLNNLKFKEFGTNRYNDRIFLEYERDLPQVPPTVISLKEQAIMNKILADDPLTVYEKRYAIVRGVQALLQKQPLILHRHKASEPQYIEMFKEADSVANEKRNLRLHNYLKLLDKTTEPISYLAFKLYRMSRIKIRFSEYDKLFSFELKEGTLFNDYIHFHSDKLKQLLGLSDDTNNFLQETRRKAFQKASILVTCKYPADFNQFTRHLYVYTNLIKYSAIGNVQAPIIRVVLVPEYSQHEASSYNYAIPQYYQIITPNIHTISIGLYDETGENITFKNLANVLVVLHFRKKDKFRALE